MSLQSPNAELTGNSNSGGASTATASTSGSMACLCVPKPHPIVMPRWNRLSWRDDRAVPLCSMRPGLAIQVEGALEAENAALRHQLIVLRRRPRGRVRLTNLDRSFFIQLYRWFPAILKILTLIRSETLVRWHRAGFHTPST